MPSKATHPQATEPRRGTYVGTDGALELPVNAPPFLIQLADDREFQIVQGAQVVYRRMI